MVGGVTKIVEKDGVWECYSEVCWEGGSVVQAEKEVFPLVVEGGGGGGGHCGAGVGGGGCVAVVWGEGVGRRRWLQFQLLLGMGILLALFWVFDCSGICPWFGLF